MRTHRWPCWLGVALLCMVAGVARAQSAKLKLERVRAASMPQLTTYLTLTEGDGSVITGRSAADFRLILDSAEVGPASRLIAYEQAGEPVSLIVVTALTPVMEPVLAEVRAGVRRLSECAGRYRGSRMGLIGYAADVKRLIESAPAGEVRGQISRLAVDSEGAEPRLLEALRVSVDLLRMQEPGRRKLIVVVSDGIDVNNERRAFQEVGRRAQQAGVIVDTVGFAPFDGRGLRNLGELTRAAYGTERVAKTAAEIEARFAALIDEIDRQYIATFTLPILGDNREHSFQVVYEAGVAVYSGVLNGALPPAPLPKERRRWPWLLVAGVGLVLLLGVGLLWHRGRRPAVSVPPGAPTGDPVPAPLGKDGGTEILPEPGQDVVAWIFCLNGPMKGKPVVLKDRTVIGTEPDCDVVLGDRYASGHHAEIRQVKGGEYLMTDLGSKNGVLMNSARKREHVLIDNDSFRIGSTEFKFKSISC